MWKRIELTIEEIDELLAALEQLVRWLYSELSAEEQREKANELLKKTLREGKRERGQRWRQFRSKNGPEPGRHRQRPMQLASEYG